MPDVDVGLEELNDEDRSYSGSRFRDVVDALFANPYQKVWGRAGEPALPEQDVTIKSVFGGLLSLAKPPRFQNASARTLSVEWHQMAPRNRTPPVTGVTPGLKPL